MQLLHAEWRKQGSFRETWIGYILGLAFLLLSFYMERADFYPVPEQYRWQYWGSMQQNIYSYGATLTAFLIVIGLSRLFCYERERNVGCLLRTAAKGLLGSYTSKTVLTIQYCAAVVAIIGILSIAVNGSAFAFAGALAPVTECRYFSGLPISNLTYCIVQYLFLLLGALYFAGFIQIVAMLVKRSTWVVVICGGCFMVSLGYYYVGLPWMIQGTWFEQMCDFLFYYGFSGFMLQESYSNLSDITGMMTGDWTQIWRPVLLVVIIVIAEFGAVWLLWRRKGRK